MKKPFSTKALIIFLLFVIFVLSIMSGYFHALMQTEQKKYSRLENNYVRVRGELGVHETQRLIDQSYNK